MRKQILSALIVALSTSLLLVSCRKDVAEHIPQQENQSVPNAPNNNAQGNSKKVYVSSVSQLYSEINNPQNTGSTIVLAPGTYMLSANYPKAGRLELLKDMSLRGQPGHPEAVIIDVTALPLSSFTIAGTNSRTGAVRIGDGSNSIEWITFQNDPAHTIRSIIQTDLVGTPTTHVRVAHSIIKGSSIGISIINRDQAANGRVLEADIEDNEIMDNIIQQFGSGIQIQNTTVSNAILRAGLSRNYIHGDKAGILAFNSSAQRSSLEVTSHTDRIENNGIGILLNGGFILNAGTPTLDNIFTFEAYATSVKYNAGIPAPPFVLPATGVHMAAGQSMPPFGPPGTAHRNTLSVSFHGATVEDNGGDYEINAYGGHSFYPSLTPVGSYNTAKLYLHGVSKKASVRAINSVPVEPAGTNTVAVYR